MKIIRDIKEMQHYTDSLRLEKKQISLVPTMGYLHQGHLALVEEAKKYSDCCVLSIFVNPTQFAPGEDLDRYPRDFKQDEQKAEKAGVDVIFYPNAAQMYNHNHKSYVEVEDLSSVLCGVSRPTHFRGVTTIVSKLFNIVKPHISVFGQKDAQQAAIIQKMIDDLNFDIDMIVAPIYREKDGLAMSSRNVNLTPSTRKQAVILHESLKYIQDNIQKPGLKLNDILNEAKTMIGTSKDAQLDYLEARSYPNLEKVEKIEGKVLISLAVYFKDVRLIDNIIVKTGK